MTVTASMHPATRSRLLALPALVIALAATACGRSADATTDTAAASTGALVLGPQDVATATLSATTGGVTLSGPLEPREVVVLRAQVNGTLSGLRVDRGSAVRAGQVLATIRAAGVQSQAAGARAGVAAAQANLAVARQRLEASRTLRDAGAIADIDHRGAQAAYEAAQAQVAAARAQSTSASEAAGFTTIVSPLDGIVSDRTMQDGESVKPGDALLSVVNGSTLELSGQIAITDAARVRVGQAVAFTLDAYPGETFRGRVARIDPVADAGTRQVGVYVELPNPTGRIIGGQYARGTVATLGTGAAPQVMIPATAVQEADTARQSGYVLAVQGGRIARRLVQLGARDDAAGTIAVRSGLEAGERVIATPAKELKPGTAVTFAGDAAGARALPMAGTPRKE
jgi:membrane fusion protein (multidrug efflux system)